MSVADVVVTFVGAGLSGGGLLGAAVSQFVFDPDAAAPSDSPGKSSVPSSRDLKRQSGVDVETWGVSDERTTYFARRHRVYATALGGLLSVVGGVLLLATYPSGSAVLEITVHGHYERFFGSMTTVAGGVVIAYSFLPYLSARSAFRARRFAFASALVSKAIDDACEEPDSLQIQQLFRLNRRQLDEYQSVTRRQQRSAFLLAQAATLIAFAVLIAGIIITLSSDKNIDKYITGGLSALGSALSAFVAATFFSLQKDANRQMYRYYLEPQRTGRLIAAERAANKLKDMGADPAVLSSIVNAVLGWEMPLEDSQVPTTKSSDGT